MKTRSTLLILATLLSMQAYAGADKGGNGGDICEDRFKIVRDDISSWINKGGPNGLVLPSEVSIAQYDSIMSDQIEKAQVSCTSDKIMIGDSEKTCKNFVSAGGASRIICNSKRFLETSDSDQYVLVHHEYAGLSGLETNDGEDSRYPISNQISGYLIDQVVKKLAVNPQLPQPSGFVCACQAAPIDKESGMSKRTLVLVNLASNTQVELGVFASNSWANSARNEAIAQASCEAAMDKYLACAYSRK